MKKDVWSLVHKDQNASIAHTLAQRQGQHARLERELAMAFSEIPWNQLHVQRTANEIAAIESEMTLGH